jgi:hypothetical protein
MMNGGMVVSTALGELADILCNLEHNDLAVKHISIEEQSIDEVDEIQMDVCVGVPVLQGNELCDDVVIEAGDTDLREERLEVELSISVPTEALDTLPSVPSSGQQTESSPTIETIRSTVPGVPAYKDPEALRTAYENYETFPRMTEALDVDVTSETVRRYMVEHGIHNPENEPETIDNDVEDTTHSEPDVSRGTKTNDGPNVGDKSVAKLLGSMEQDTTKEIVMTDGMGILSELTLTEFVEIINRSRTVSEVKQELKTDYNHTRHLLDELELLKYVTGRLSSTQQELTLAEFCQQMDLGNDPDNTASSQ